MTYNPAIPAAADDPSVSQGQMLTNFAQANTLFGVNHVNFDSSLPAGVGAGNAGKHYAVTIIDQAAAPVTAANECALYSLATGGDSTLWFSKESAGTAIQMTGPDPVIASPGQTFLPGGIILKWGTAVVNTGGTAVGFAVAFPNNCWNVQVTPESTQSRGAAIAAGVGVGGFTAYAENNGTTMHWVAIGN